MIKNILIFFIIITCLSLITGCEEESPQIPKAIAMTEEAVGHYCNMSIFEHTGPKAQVHLKNIEAPIWFSQVRDAIAYMRLPEETLETVAIYVNDMGKAQNWEFPEDNTWINVNDAFFVINSKKSGGMGAPEAVPFGTHDQANIFTSKYGGEIVKLNDIPDDYILAPVDLSTYEMEKAGEVK